MKAKDRKIARENCLARLEPIDPELAEEVRAMWVEEEAEKKGKEGRRSPPRDERGSNASPC